MEGKKATELNKKRMRLGWWLPVLASMIDSLGFSMIDNEKHLTKVPTASQPPIYIDPWDAVTTQYKQIHSVILCPQEFLVG